MSIRFRSREFQQWSRRQFMMRAVREMFRSGRFTMKWRREARDTFRRLAAEDRELARLLA